MRHSSATNEERGMIYRILEAGQTRFHCWRNVFVALAGVLKELKDRGAARIWMGFIQRYRDQLDTAVLAEVTDSEVVRGILRRK